MPKSGFGFPGGFPLNQPQRIPSKLNKRFVLLLREPEVPWNTKNRTTHSVSLGLAGTCPSRRSRRMLAHLSGSPEPTAPRASRFLICLFMLFYCFVLLLCSLLFCFSTVLSLVAFVLSSFAALFFRHFGRTLTAFRLLCQV